MSDIDYTQLCECGCELQEHHISYFFGGGVLVDECESYGFNEAGGMKWNEETEKWEDHCYKFRPVQ